MRATSGAGTSYWRAAGTAEYLSGIFINVLIEIGQSAPSTVVLSALINIMTNLTFYVGYIVHRRPTCPGISSTLEYESWKRLWSALYTAVLCGGLDAAE